MSRLLLAITMVLAAITSTYAEDEDGKGDRESTLPVTMQLWKFPYTTAKRTTFRLELEEKAPNVTVRAWCELRQGAKGVGRFPLRMDRHDGKLRIVVACLADEFIKDSKMRVQVLQGEESVGFLVIPLDEAKLDPARKTKEESSAKGP